MLKTNTYKIDNAYIVTQEYGTNIGWVATFPGFVANGDTESNALAALAREVIKVGNTIERYAKIGRDSVPANLIEAITADNITDEQIRALMRGDFGPCEETRTMCTALSLSTFVDRTRARARCAEIINARVANKGR